MKPGQQPTCRFNFPKNCQDETTIDFQLITKAGGDDHELTVEEITRAQVKATLTTNRNDGRINSHNYVMLQHWRANVDLQVMLTLTSASGTWQNTQRKVNLDHSPHLRYYVY